MLIGTHVSISGGYLNAATEAKRLGIDTMQIFTKNQRTWQEKVVSEEEGKSFRKACAASGIRQVFSHTIYLISMGAADEEIAKKSMLSLAMELERCRALGLSHTVLHPGGHGTLTPGEGIRRIGDRIKKVLEATPKNPTKILLENTAGGGTTVGGKMEYLGELISYIGSKRIGLCIDTCHAFAAGYDIRDLKGIKKFMKEIDRHIGLEKLLCFHVNDSKGGLGSRIDRHAHIGEGLLGLVPFGYILKNFSHIPRCSKPQRKMMRMQKI